MDKFFLAAYFLVTAGLSLGSHAAFAGLQTEGVAIQSGGSVRIETVIAITSVIVGLATAYLRLYVGNEMNKMKESLQNFLRAEVAGLRAEVVTKELHVTQLRNIEHRLDVIEKDKK